MGAFILEANTTTGRICERYDTFADAQRRREGLPAESLVGLPFIFQELADGSQRLVREDGKPLQWHRVAEDAPGGPDEPLPLVPGTPDLRFAQRPMPIVRPQSPDEDAEELPPLALADEWPPAKESEGDTP